MSKSNTFRLRTVMSTLGVLFVVLVFLVIGFVRSLTPTASAAASTYLNFQARLMNASGAVVPDGDYNVEFKLYDAATSGNLLWTETRTTTDRVRVANGYMTVNLGSVTAFGGSIPWGERLWLTMNIGGTGTPSWDGEMDPRLLLTAVPLAFRATSAYGVNSDNTTGVSTNSNNVTIGTGNASGSTSNSGNISIDVGTATGTAGTISLGATSASGLLLGRAGFTTTIVGTALVQGGTVTVGGAAQAGSLVLYDSDAGSETVTLQGGAVTASYNLTLPTAAGSTSQCLQTDSVTASQLVFGSCGTGGSGDSITVQGVAATDPNFINTTATGTVAGVTITLDTAATPDTIAITISNASATEAGTVTTGTQTFAGVKTFNDNIVLATGKTLTVTGDVTANRPASPTEGMVYFDTTTKQLLTYANGKWQADRTDAILVAASNSTQAEKDAADYVADGTADQTEINSALTEAAGGKVILLAGTYNISASILMLNNTQLVGTGDSTLMRVANSTNASFTMIGDSATEGVVVRDVKLDGNKAGQTSGTIGGIGFDGVSGSTSNAGARIEYTTIVNMSGTGMPMGHNNYMTIENNYVANNDSHGFSTGQFASYNSITGNTFIGNGGIGIEFDYGNDHRITNNIIKNNGSVGINAENSDSVIENNRIDSNGSYGISMLGNNNQITGNNLSNNVSGGLYTEADNAAISNNTLTNNGGATTNNGIFLNGSADNNSIISNKITDNSCTTNCYAIAIADSGSDNNYLADNTYRTTAGTDQATINDAGTGTRYASQLSPAQILQSSSTVIKANTTTVLTGTIDPIASTTITGVGTKFLTELQVGDRITVSGETRTVTAIASDLSLTVDTATTDTANDTTPDRLPAALRVTNSAGTQTLLVNDIGAATFRNSTNSTAAFVIQNAAGTSLLNIDTSTPTVTIGSTAGATGVSILAGTGNINIGNAAVSNTIQIGAANNINTDQTINIGNNIAGTSSSSVTLGSFRGSSNVVIQSGTTGNIEIGNGGNGYNNTIQIGAGGADKGLNSGQTINIGNNSAGTAGQTSITIGSSRSTSVTNIFSGSGGINLNVSANQATNINTGTSTGAVSIGNSAAGAISLQSASTVGVTGTTTITGLTSGAALTVNNSTSTGNILTLQDNGVAVLGVTDGGNLVAGGAATATTGTTTGTGTNTTTLTLTTDAFAVNDVVFIDNVGQDYYTRITADPATGSYTVSPAVTFETGRTVTKYNVQNIGATATDYTTTANRFFQGYFLGGVVTGAGSTSLSDGLLQSTGALTISATSLTLSGLTGNLVVGTADTTGSLLVLDTKTDATDPTGVAGGMYYNSSEGNFKCYQNGAWVNCVTGSDSIIVAASNSSAYDKAIADYVADGTGDQTEINSALTAADPAGSGRKTGKVTLLAGTYVANATILIPNNTTLEGTGPGTVIEMADIDIADNLIENSDTTTGTGVTIRDLKLDGRSDLNTAGIQNGIYLSGLGNGTGGSARLGGSVSSMFVEDFRDSGVYLNNSDNNVVTDNTFKTSVNGLYINGSTNNQFSNNTTLGNSGVGFYLLTSNNNTFSGNTAQGNASKGFAVDDSGSNTFTGNIAQSNGTGFWLWVGSRNIFTGNTSDSNTESGFYFYASNYNTFTGNNSSNNGSGFNGDTNSADNSIIGNRIHNNGGATANSGVGIDRAHRTIISDNDITDTSCTTTCVAITINAATDNVYIGGNRLNGATISDSGNNTVYANQATLAYSDFIYRSANSATAFAVQNAAGTSVLNVNTSTAGVAVTGTLSSSNTLTVSAGGANITGGLTVVTGSTFTNASSSLFTAIAISDVAAGGNIGTAATTVDVATTFNVNQTTASQTLTLPSPTTTTSGRIAYVNNVGTASFTMYSVVVTASASQSYIWNGTAWTPASIDTDTNTTYTAGNDLDLTGTTFDLESQLDFVSVINQTSANLTLQTTTTGDILVNAAGSFNVGSGDLVVNSSGNTTVGGTLTVGNVLSATNITIGTSDTTGTLLVLDTKTDAGDPAGVAGGMYYNSSEGNFKCYQNGAWVNCIAGASSTVVVAANNSPAAIKATADYVADGTGDQTEINAALTAAAGGKVYLAEGTYSVSATITIPNNTTLTGAGRNTLIQLADIDVTDNLIENSSVPGVGVTISNLRIDGNDGANLAGTQHGIYLNRLGDGWSGAVSGSIEDVWADNFRNDGIYLIDSDNVSISDVTATANDNGITFAATGLDNATSHNTVTNSHFISNAAAGVNSAGGTGNVITGNTFEYNAYGVHFSGGQGVVISSNSFYNETTSAIYINGFNGQIIANNIVSSGGSTTNNSIWMYGSSADGNYISGNYITDGACSTTCYAINISTTNADGNNLGINSMGGGTVNDAGSNGTVYSGQGAANNDIRFRGANSTTAFAVQNASGTSVLNINTSTAGATVSGTLTVTGATEIQNNLTVTNAGNVAFQKGTDYSTVGSANDVNFGTGVLFRLTGASAQTITGIAGGADGRILTLVNAGTTAATISNNSVSSLAANRVITGTGADLSVAAGASVSLVYDTTASLWRAVGTSSAGGSPTAGNDIDVTGNTIDIESQLDFVTTINQTSANLTLQTTTTGDILVNAAGSFNVGAGDLVVNASGNTTVGGTLTVGNVLSATNITLGTSDTTGTLLVLDTKTDATDPAGVNGAMYYNSNIGKFRCYEGSAWKDCLTGGGTGTKMVVLNPEYEGGLLYADGSNNNGTMTSDYDSTNRHNYYEWSTSQGTAQDYDIVIKHQLPSNFNSTNEFKASSLKARTWVSNMTNAAMTISIIDEGGTTCLAATTIEPSANSTWQQTTIDPTIATTGINATCALVADENITIIIKVTSVSPNTDKVRVSDISYQYDI